MSKYIDADRLKAEIEKRMNICDGIFERDSDTYYQGKAVAYQETLSLIDSLQQEQPAKRGYKDCNGCEYNRLLKDQIGWQFRGCFGGDYKGKPIAEIELCPLKVAQQEQPSDDLEAEMEKYFDGWFDDPEYGQAVLPHTYQCVGVSDCKDIARHFYILGLKNNIPVTQITLDELAKEGEPINEDLEEEIEMEWDFFNKHLAEYGEESEEVVWLNWNSFEDIARHFAEWQKQQMLKDAVEAEVHYFGETQGVPRSITIPRMQEWLKPFKDGDKVKIVIVPIKEDK